MSRKNFQSKKRAKSKWIIVTFILLFAFVGVSLFAMSQYHENRSVEESRQFENSVISSEESFPTEPTTQSLTSSSSVSKEFPFSVDIVSLLNIRDEGEAHPISDNVSFHCESVNAPEKIELGRGPYYHLGTCVMVYSYNATEYIEDAAIYGVEITDIPTKEIEIFGGEGTDGKVRSVKVNTQIRLIRYFPYPENNDNTNKGYLNLEGEIFYLFYNNQGTVSLATQNFAGNVATPEETKIMQEYVQEF